MLTLSNLKAFAEDLNIIKIELDELIKVRSQEKLFNGSDDYYNALKVCEFYPQDYFKFRMFDFSFELKFNNRNKQFYIHCESVKPMPLDFYNIKEYLHKNKIEVNIQNNNLYLPYDLKFDNVVRLFAEFIIAFLRYYISPQVLFSYEL